MKSVVSTSVLTSRLPALALALLGLGTLLLALGRLIAKYRTNVTFFKKCKRIGVMKD